MLWLEGFPFFDRATQKQGKAVAYIFNDGGENEIKEVFKKFGTKDGEVLLHCGAVPDRATEWLLQMVDTAGLRFVIVDTLQRFFRFQNVNDYGEVTNAMEALLNGIQSRRCHVLFIHHAKKDSSDALDSAVGSTALRGLCYSFIHYRRLLGSEQRIIMTDQRGGRNLPDSAIGFDARGWLQITGTLEDAELENMKHRVKELLSVAEGPLSRNQIHSQMWPCRDFILINRAIKELYEAGDIDRRGPGTSGHPFRYVLAEPSSVAKRALEIFGGRVV